MPADAVKACLDALSSQFGARASCEPQRLRAHAWDFGRLIQRQPALIVAVRDAGEVSLALKTCADFGVPVSTRGSGHSMSGASLSDAGVILDMRGLARVEIDVAQGWAWVDGGATWHRVANAAFEHQHLPLGLTMIVDTTVGGTLSLGGLGSESFRTGTQADQVLELEVATLEGGLERCSPDSNRELYDCVRAGLGQCGVIVRARYPLRPARAWIRSHAFVYADADALVDDLQALSADPRCEFMCAGLIWDERDRGRWQTVLLLGREFGHETELRDASFRSGLRYTRELPSRDDPQWRPDGAPGHRFFRAYRAHPWDDPALPQQAHPWVDHVFEPAAGRRMLGDVLARPPVCRAAGTAGEFTALAPHVNRAPLLCVPAAQGPLIYLGLFPEVSDRELAQTLPHMQQHAERGCTMGGRRYLTSVLDGWSAGGWAEHYDRAWPWFQAMKRRYDGRGLLNRGCIPWPAA